MLTVQPVKRRKKLCVRVVEQVKAYIAQNNLKPGDRLPTQNEMAERLGVSRSTVREAMKALEIMGIVRTRPKIGCVVQAVDMKKALAEHFSFRFGPDGVTLYELSEARELLETAVLPLVIERATEEHFATMEAALRMPDQENGDGWTDVDLDEMFHEALFGAAGNRVLEGFADIIRQFFSGLREMNLASKEGGFMAFSEHSAIYQAVRASDEAQAREEMRRHLSQYSASESIAPRKPAKMDM